MSLVLFPQQPTLRESKQRGSKVLQRTKSGRSDLSDELNHRFVFSTGQNSSEVPPKWKTKTWQSFKKDGKDAGSSNKNFNLKDLKSLTQWWNQNSREELEQIWQHVWLPTIDGMKSKAQIITRLELWRTVQQKQNEETGSVNKQRARTEFYKLLNGETKGKHFLGITQEQLDVRIDRAVAMMGNCVKRIKEIYKLDAVDYFRLISHNQKEISMVWDFLFDMFGDLIEKQSGGGYTSRRSAKDKESEYIAQSESVSNDH